MEAWARRLHRLKAMDRREVATRLQQLATSRSDWLRYRGGHDFASSNPDLDFRPAGHFFFAPAEVPALCTTVSRVLPAEAAEIASQAQKLCKHRFDLLGYSDLDYGSRIDWHLDRVHGKRGPRRPWFEIEYLNFDQVGDSKVTWELNRHQHFPILAKAYWLTGNEEFVREIFSQWEQWQLENPYPVGMNWASSLEVALRSLSWIWTFFLLDGCPLFTSDLRRRWVGMLSLSGRHIDTYLSTYFSPNTHLLGEALALFFLGTLFHLPSAVEWRRQGWKVLLSEAEKQVRPDGFYFEQSTYYHVYALDMLLHARILAGLNQIAVPEKFDRTIGGMLSALALLSRAGVPPMFGDDDGGRLFDARRNGAEQMLDSLATGAVLYQRGDLKALARCPREETIWLLGEKGLAEFGSLPVTAPTSDSTALTDSGLYLMTDGRSSQQLVMDAGPLGAGSGGHGHADALSVWLVRDGQNLLRDSGTFEYVGESGERPRLRSTIAHNTLRVDGQDQARSTGPFSWDRFPLVRVRRGISGKEFDLLEASHDGFSRFSSPVTHRRLVFHRKDAFWFVRDIAEGTGLHQLELAWHVGEGLSPANGQRDVFANTDATLAIVTADDHGWSRELREENWSPKYGVMEKAPVLRFSASAELPAEFVTLLVATASHGSSRGRLIRSGEFVTGKVFAYQYIGQTGTASFVFAERAESWTHGSWASDADFLYAQQDDTGRLTYLVFCNGSYVDFEDGRAVSCKQRVSYAEISRENERWKGFCPESTQLRLGPQLDGKAAITRH
jgi:hypothetical protein